MPLASASRGSAAKTIRNHLGVLHSVFKLAQRGRWCPTNPVALADGPKVRRNRTRIRFLTQEELEAVIRVAGDHGVFGDLDPVLFLTAGMTGLRQSEILALRWRQVEWVS